MTTRRPSARSSSSASRHRRPSPSTRGSPSSWGNGCATSMTSTGPDATSGSPSVPRRRRATSRRSPTSFSIDPCSSAGPATGRPPASSPTGRRRCSSAWASRPSRAACGAHASTRTTDGSRRFAPRWGARQRPRSRPSACSGCARSGSRSLAVGDLAAADCHLAGAVAALAEMGFREPAIWRIDGDAIEAALAVGDVERAERAAHPVRVERGALADPLEPRRQRALPRPLPRRAGGAASGRRCARGSARRARAEPGPLRACPDAARPRAGAGAGSSRSGVRGPRSSARWRSSTSSGRCRGRREHATSSGARRPAPRRIDLSETELRIARLAAAGLTNEAIASEVFVTRKTVEANLSRAYRKLGIRSRAQLARALDARENATIP